MNNETENYWCRKCFKNIEATGEECPVCGDKMFSPATIKGFGLLAIIGGFVFLITTGFCLILVLIGIFFGTALKDKFSLFTVSAILIFLLIVGIQMVRVGREQQRTGILNAGFVRSIIRSLPYQ
ncbi:MAG: hypothetical protein AAB336_10005 [Acidobacteriota bacterium]